MPRLPIEYRSHKVYSAKTGRENVGRILGLVSLVIPFLAFALIAVTIPLTGHDPSQFEWNLCMSSLFVSCFSGLVGLGGMFWWGERGVLVPSILGISVSVTWL